MTSTDIPNAYYDAKSTLEGIVESGNARKGLGILGGANLTDEQVTKAYEEARKLTTKGGDLHEINDAIKAEWLMYTEIMSQKGVPMRQREEQAEVHRKNIIELERQGIDVYAQYTTKWGLNTGFFEGMVNNLQSVDRTIEPLTVDERRAAAVTDRYESIMPTGYEDEVMSVVNATNEHGTTTVWANPPSSWTAKGVKYDIADFGAEDDVSEWYGNEYFRQWDALMKSPYYANYTDAQKLQAIQKVHSLASEYAKKQFFANYVRNQP